MFERRTLKKRVFKNMNSKEKRFFILLIVIFVVLVLFYIFSKFNKKIVYANNQDIANIKFSNAQNFNLDEVINKNNKVNSERIITEEINLEYITQYKNTEDLPEGVIQVIQEGRTGKKQITKRITIDENSEEHEEEISSIIITSPANKIVQVGTSKKNKNYKISKGSEVYVVSDSAEVKRENSYDSAKITTLIRNTQLKVLDIKNEWCKIYISGQYGWIKTENIALKTANSNSDNMLSGKKITYNIEMELNKPSGLSLEQFKKVLTDNNDKNNIFCDNAEYFYYIENEYNINRFAKLLSNLKIDDYKIDVVGKTYIILFKYNFTADSLSKISSEALEKAYIRGSFLGAGSINNPEKKYHLEITFSNEEYSIFARKILEESSIFAKILEKSIYFKDGEEISKFLAFIGANSSVIKFEEVRVVREMKNNVNRLVNCETANMNKTISTAVKQTELISKIRKDGKFAKLPEDLKEIANLREKNPNATLEELGKMLKNPIGKSSVSHRFKKIEEYL